MLSDSIVLRHGYGFLGILIIVLNVSSVVCKYRFTKKRKDIIVFINLSFSDILMGVYFFMISLTDGFFNDNFIILSDQDVIQWSCSVIGILPILSTVQSNTIHCLIAIQRLLAIKYHFVEKCVNMESFRNQHVVLISCWMASLCVAVLYLRISTPTSLLCFMSFTTNSSPQLIGWTVVLFIAYGFLTFVASLSIYGTIIQYVMATEQVQYTKERTLNIRVIRRIGLIMSTFLLSWMSVSTLIMYALLSDISHTYVDKLLIVLSLPLNGILNPIVYTLLPLLTSAK